MLGIMRKYKESIMIKLVFGVIVLSFVGTIFLVWGKGGAGPRGSVNYAAKVNGTKISLQDYEKSYYRLRDIYSQLYGRSMTPEAEKQLGIKKAALDNLIDSALIRQAAKDMDLSVGKDEVAKAVAAIPAFQKDGAFNFNQYVQVLKSNRLTPQEFEDAQQDELLIKKARKTIQDKVTVSDSDAIAYFHKTNDKLVLAYATVSPADVQAEVKLTDQDLNSYLQAHQDQFRTPEKVSIQYILFDPASIAAKATVSDQEIQTFYSKNIDRYQGKGGILPLAEVKEKVKADALKDKISRQAYEMAADAVNKNLTAGNLQAVATALGTKISETPLFTAKQPPAQFGNEPNLIQKAFLLKGTELGGPIETSKGIYAIKLKERKPAEVPPLAQIRAQVEAAAKLDKAKELAREKAQSLQANLAKGGEKLQDTGSFSYNPQGQIPGIGQSPELMEAAFNLTSAAPLPKTPIKLGDRWIVFKLKSRTAASEAEFQKNKEQIKQSLLPQKQQEAVDTWLKGLRAKATIEINQALLAD